MSKIRINELARELEVKPNVILETLAELGIADKKTHSSSLDDDVALQVRQRVTGEAGGSAPEISRHRESTEESSHTPETVHAQPAFKAPAPRVESPAESGVAGITGVKETQPVKSAEE